MTDGSDKPCDGRCCPDAPRCSGRELIAAEIRAMQVAISPGNLSESDALAALEAAEPHLGADYNLMRAALAAAPVLYSGFAGLGPGIRRLCLSETVYMLRAAIAVRRRLRDALMAKVAADLSGALSGGGE